VNLLEGKATSLEPYNAKVTNVLALYAAASWGAKIALDRYPRLTFNVGRLPVVWGAVERMLSGDLKDPGSERGPARYALKVIERLARWAGDPGAAYRAEANTA
jgi:hypothetical protein